MKSHSRTGLIAKLYGQISGYFEPSRRKKTKKNKSSPNKKAAASSAQITSQTETVNLPATPPASGSLINRSALIETAVFLSAAVLLDFMFGDGTRYMGTALHPFWIIILLVTVQYGPLEALITALLSGAVLLVGNMPEQSLSETMYQYIIRVMLTPILWVLTALVLGSLRARQRNERKNLQEQLWRTEQASNAIIENYKIAKQSKEKLELRLAEERCSVLTVYEVAKSLETLDPDQAVDGFEKLVRTALNPKKFSFYRWRNNSLGLYAAYGWDKTDTYEDDFHRNTSLAVQIIRERRVLSIIREEDEKYFNGQGMLAGPIVDEETGRIFGMLKIEEIGFTDLGIRTHETFRIICAWIARVCVNVEKHQDAQAQDRYAVPTSKNGKKRRTSNGFSGSDTEETDNAA